MKRTTTLLTAASAAVLIAIAGCGGGEESNDAGGDGGATQVRVANLPVAATMVLNVADEQGFFADHGIDVEITESSELATFIPALGRQYDVVMTTPTDFLVSATTGFDIAALGGGWADGAGVISADAQSIDDLEGARIATNSLTGLQYAMLQDSLEQAGVTAELVQVPFSSQPDQLRAGEVDAATVPEPFSSDLLKDGEFSQVFVPVDEATGQTGTLTGWYSTSREYAEANPEVVDGFKLAIAEAMEWIQANEADFRELLVDKLDIDPELAQELVMPGFTDQVTADDLGVYVGPLVRQEQLDSAAEDLDLSEYVL